MNEKLIQRSLMLGRYSRSIVCPNYTPKDWFECDLIEVTKSGFFREYEIKLTLSDFRADRSKKANKRVFVDGQLTTELQSKHQRLADGDINGPVQFWFVCPKGLIPHTELPAWSGLIEVEASNPRRPYCGETIRAPRLHRSRLDPKVKEHLMSIFYWRFIHHLIRNHV